MQIFLQTLRSVFLDVIADFLYTPVWWYSRGLFKQLRASAESLAARADALAVDIWLKNIFTPMYGQYDIVGRLISFLMRTAQIIGRTIVLVIWAVLLLVWIFVWLLIPAGVGYLIYIQLSS